MFELSICNQPNIKTSPIDRIELLNVIETDIIILIPRIFNEAQTTSFMPMPIKVNMIRLLQILDQWNTKAECTVSA